MCNEMISEEDVNILDLPTIYIDFDGNFMASCGLANQVELLDLCHEYFQDWFTHRYSLQDFAEKFANEHISLWTAKTVKAPSAIEGNPFFSFIIKFEQTRQGYVLVQCQLNSQDKVH